MTMQNVTSNIVFVVALGQDPLKWSSLTFKETAVERGYYYHPVGGSTGVAAYAAEYVGFRFDGRLQRVRHVDHYEVITRPHEYIPEIIPEADWTDQPHFLYSLASRLSQPSRCSTATSGRTRDVVRTGPPADVRDDQLRRETRPRNVSRTLAKAAA